MKRLLLLAVATLPLGFAGHADEAREVSVCFENETATVEVSADIAPLVAVQVAGANVVVEQDEGVAEEITYRLRGASANGSFVLKGDFKVKLSLEGLNLTSQEGAAINIKNSKRIGIVLKDGTENMLADKEGGGQKACMTVKGHLEIEGGGALTVNGRGKHALKSNEYVELKATTGCLTLNSTVKDGIHTDEFVLIKGGTLNILTTGNGYWDEEEQETKAPSCINSAMSVTILDGSLNLQSTGDGGKGVSCDSLFTMKGGSLTVSTTGKRYVSENYEGSLKDTDAIPDSLKNSPKAVKADLGICITGGTMTLYTEQDGGEGLESKDTLAIRGGSIRIEAFDDCINAAGNVGIHGGDLFLSSLDNDGIDTNQSMYITGGSIVTQGNFLHELGIDVNDKSPYKKLYLTGGTVVSVGGTSQISHPYTCQGAQPALYYKGKIKAGTELLLRCQTDGSDVMSYTMERDYKAEAGGSLPELCIMLSSPKLAAGKGYQLINATSGATIAAVGSLAELYSNMEASETHFSRESFSLGQNALPYRKAEICHDGMTKPALALYLHGGSARGNDNEAQLKEKAVSVICQYLTDNGIAATFIVPQCPSGGGWTSQNRKVVNELLKSYVGSGAVDADRVYVMGGSMGGTGTWCQLSYFPDFYAAAMPVAGNPAGMNAGNVATTPVLTVMGTADAMMSIANVEAFMAEVTAAGGFVQLDVEEGWSHPMTCEQSYTDERLAWLFSQVRGAEDAIGSLTPGSSAAGDGNIYDLCGRPQCHPTRGIYIKAGRKILFP